MLATGVWALAKPALATSEALAFQVSLNELSLQRTLTSRRMDHLDLAKWAKEHFGISAIEYVSRFFRQRAHDEKYLMEMNKRAADHNVRQLVIMVDGEGRIGDPDAARRELAVRNHHKWVDAAKTLGCHSIEVDTTSTGTPEERLGRIGEGFRALCEYAEPHHINILVGCRDQEAADVGWLLRVMQQVDHPACGVLPTFASLVASTVKEDVAKIVRLAKGICATARDFDAEGHETRVDFFRGVSVLLESGYRGYVSIAYQGDKLTESDGIRATKALLEATRSTARSD